ncbi:MAG: hypothetical protein ACPG8W_02945 [Candidatus Promineifilaceae bacterium]
MINIITNVFAPIRALPMIVRRIINAAISFVIGWIGMALSVAQILGTTLPDYGTVYIVFTVLSIAAGVAIWLDHENVLDTKILPH